MICVEVSNANERGAETLLCAGPSYNDYLEADELEISEFETL